MDYIEEFEKRLLPVDCQYCDREDRNRFAAEWISKDILPHGGRILNIGGGGRRHLQSKLGNQYEVFEIDMQGDCDLVFNLDSGPLPLEDEKFQLSCAFDVLEHLENFHSVLDEIFGVSSEGLLISLPISTGEALFVNILGLSTRNDHNNSGVRNKYYGLPLIAPVDRHRWWLSFVDVVRFFVKFEEKEGVKVNFAIPYRSVKGFRKMLLRKIIGRSRFYEIFVSDIWILISK